MGLIAARINMLLDAKQKGVDFSHTLTLGRQRISLSRNEIKQINFRYKLNLCTDCIDELLSVDYAEQILYKMLNINKLTALDISKYECAEIQQDLNIGIPKKLEKRYDVIIDGGSLEHIFNFPVAISNCMKMVKEGGNIFIFSMANNHCGHGFYQFSPELFFRVFQPENGFHLKSVTLVKHPFPGAELSEKQQCYEVTDPAILGRRASLVTKSPLGIMIHAKKIQHIKIFEQFPIQSDYLRYLNIKKNIKHKNDYENGSPLTNLNVIIRNAVLKLPLPMKNLLIGYHQLWKFSLDRDNEMYKKK